MDLNPLYLWCAYSDDLLIDGVAEACASLLTEEENARCLRFRFDRHRREGLATRALARVALSHYYPLPPPAWRFVTGKYGKPSVDSSVAPKCRLHYNLSNSVGLVVCLIADSVEVGVDVESFARADQILQVAHEVFSAEEQAQLDALPQAGKLDRGMALWTLKEAYIKARGMGLSLPLAKISFLFGGAEGIHLQTDPVVDDNPERWRFCLLDHAGYRIAVMVESAQPRALEVLEARPVLARPVPTNVSRAKWFPLEYPSSSEEFPPRSSL